MKLISGYIAISESFSSAAVHSLVYKELSGQLAEEKRRTKARFSRPETAKNAKKTP